MNWFWYLVMSFPADGIEATYKNNIDDVRVYLDTKHPDNYVVINISQRSYRTSRLNDRVRNTIGFFNSLQISIPFLSPILDQFPFLFALKTSENLVYSPWNHQKTFSPHSDWIRRDTQYLSLRIQSECGKMDFWWFQVKQMRFSDAFWGYKNETLA